MHTNYYQLPPDGTGKKVFARKTKILYYTGKTGLFPAGEVIIGTSSGLQMNIIFDESFTASTGVLVLAYQNESNESTISWVDGEDLTVDAVTIAHADGTGEDYMSNMGSIVSHDNPYKGLLIDVHGQAYVRYLEGDQLLDATGKSMQSKETKVGVYNFSQHDLDDNFSVTLSGGSTLTQDTTANRAVLNCTTAQGDKVVVMSDKFHPVGSDQGIYGEFILASGDIGTIGLRRRAGLFYERNGIWFERNELDNLRLITRSDATGEVIDTIIENVDFNVDPADGTGKSGYQLNLTKINKMWLDWAPSNRIRFGTFDESGQRMVFHIIQCAGAHNIPPINCNALPVRFEEECLSGTASPSVMYIYDSTVSLYGDASYEKHQYEKSSDEITCTAAAWTPILSIRPNDLTNGDINRTIAELGHLSLSCVTSADGSVDGRVKVEIFEDMVLSGATFSTQREDSNFLIDTGATSASNGTAFTEYLWKGTDNINMENLTFLDNYLCNKADGTARTWTLACKAIREDVQVLGAFTWTEIHMEY